MHKGLRVRGVWACTVGRMGQVEPLEGLGGIGTTR